MGGNDTVAMLKPATLEAKPWAAIQAYVPNGYSINADGVFRERDEPEFICGPCWVAVLTRSSQGRDWGYAIHWIDQDGREQSAAFSVRKLHEARSSLAGDLAALGLKVVPGKERYLLEYLGSFQLPAPFRQRSVAQLGWLDGTNGESLYVLPERTIGASDGEAVVFQPEEHSPSIRGLRSSGSLAQWNAHVVAPCAGNPLLTFSLCAAFAGPLLKDAGLDSGGFHLYGASSKGKTTALQVAASVWGSGADPAASDDSYIGRWNTTGNALEATAAAHNDGLLALDEMGTCDARDFGKVVYDMFGGKGKSRLNKNSTLQAQRTWKVFGLSTGEISVRQKIEEDSGRKSKTGQLVRLADIPIAQGVIIDSHGEAPDTFANRLKAGGSDFYGTAGPCFLEALLARYPSSQGLRELIQSEITAWEHDLSLGKSLESHQRRVIRRFAVVATAGVLAVHLGVLRLPEAEVRYAIMAARDAWLSDESNKPEGARAVESIREFILRHPGRFRPLSNEDVVVRDLVGYEDRYQGRFLFTGKGFTEACQGLSTDLALDELERRGFLVTNEPGRKKIKQTVPGLSRMRLYVVRSNLLEEGDGPR